MRRCAFCDREIAHGDPPEHVIPKWMRRLRPKGAWFASGPAVVLQGAQSNPGTVPARPARISKVPDIETDVVCRACNGHWMSDLETRASQLMPPMTKGEQTSLTAEGQAFLSVWVIKTILMWMTVPPCTRMVPPEDYRWLHAHKLPPPTYRVRLGHYIGTALPFMPFVSALLRETLEPDVAQSDGHRTVIAFGELVFEISSTLTGRDIIRFPDASGTFLIDAWPTAKPASWPPSLIFDDAEMLRFMDITEDTSLPHPGAL